MTKWVESKFSSEKAKEYRALGAQILVVTSGVREGKGWPDWNVNCRFFSGWLELKVDANECSTPQFDRIKLLQKQGVPALVYRWDNKLEREFIYCPVNEPKGICLDEFSPRTRLDEIRCYWQEIVLPRLSAFYS